MTAKVDGDAPGRALWIAGLAELAENDWDAIKDLINCRCLLVEQSGSVSASRTQEPIRSRMSAQCR